jgi:hypothetical protein
MELYGVGMMITLGITYAMEKYGNEKVKYTDYIFNTLTGWMFIGFLIACYFISKEEKS